MGNQTITAKQEKMDGVVVKKTSLPLTENSIKVLERRYLKKDADGNATESPEELFRRVARNIAQADSEYGDDTMVEKAEHSFVHDRFAGFGPWDANAPVQHVAH